MYSAYSERLASEARSPEYQRAEVQIRYSGSIVVALRTTWRRYITSAWTAFDVRHARTGAMVFLPDLHDGLPRSTIVNVLSN